jgi:hypothetical protein
MRYRFREALAAELDLEPRAIGARAWQVRVRVYVNASDFEEKYYAKLVGRC